MGCDIHPFFETRQPDGQWKLTFGSRPSAWWNEEIIDEKLEDGSAITALGPPTDEDIAAYVAHETKRGRAAGLSDEPEALADDALRYKLEQYFKSLSDEEIETTYGHHPRYTRDFFPKELMDIGGSWCSITSRSYYWFAAICADSVEARFDYNDEDRETFKKLNAFAARGAPEDCSPEGNAEMKRWQGDGHSHSWLMCSEILAEPKCRGYDDPKSGFTAYAHREWIEKNIADPENTRMVFYFDN